MKLIVTFFLLLTAALTFAQVPGSPTTPATPGETESNPRFWQASFTNGGHYLVKLDRISSASKHEYIGNGTARVIEVTIGTDTAVVSRFYFFEPLGKDSALSAVSVVTNRVEEVAKDAASRVSPTAGRLNVVKDYPNTTHSHTVEYALQSEAALSSLYTSLMQAINTGRGRTWKESSEK